MTNREFYVAIAEAQVSDELTTKAQELIAALDSRNEKRKVTPTKDQKEAAARRDTVLQFLQSHPDEVYTRDAIAEAVNVTPGQVTAACKALADLLTKSEAKFPKGKKVVYQYNG